jgi:hypothetical protein
MIKATRYYWARECAISASKPLRKTFFTHGTFHLVPQGLNLDGTLSNGYVSQLTNDLTEQS